MAQPGNWTGLLLILCLVGDVEERLRAGKLPVATGAVLLSRNRLQVKHPEYGCRASNRGAQMFLQPWGIQLSHLQTGSILQSCERSCACPGIHLGLRSLH